MEGVIDSIRQAPARRLEAELGTLRYFETQAYATLCALCDAIIPADDECGGASDAEVPQFVDLLVSENRAYQAIFAAGLNRLEGACRQSYGNPYLECSPAQQGDILDKIAFRSQQHLEDDLEPAIRFFSLLRRLTVGGFVTSRIGIGYLKYIGNDRLVSFPGCPVPDDWPKAGSVGTKQEGDFDV